MASLAGRGSGLTPNKVVDAFRGLNVFGKSSYDYNGF